MIHVKIHFISALVCENIFQIPHRSISTYSEIVLKNKEMYANFIPKTGVIVVKVCSSSQVRSLHFELEESLAPLLLFSTLIFDHCV